MEILTDQEIKEDIQNYEQRIVAVRKKLESLPAGRLPFPEHKRREKQRRELQADLTHVKKIDRLCN